MNGTIGAPELVGIRTSDSRQYAAVRVVETPSPGMLFVTAEPQMPGMNLEITVLPHTGGSIPLAKGPSPVETPKLPKGRYVVVVQGAPGAQVVTRANLQVLHKPENADENSGDDHTKNQAIKLSAGQKARGNVDYSGGDATDIYKLIVPSIGDLEIDFEDTVTSQELRKFEAFQKVPFRGAITAQVEDPEGKMHPLKDGKLKLVNAAAGEYYVRVAANDVGAGGYALSTKYSSGNPDAQSGEDATQDGATVVELADKNGRFRGAAKDEVSFDKQDATDWFKIEAPEEGKLSVVLKTKDRSSKVRAEFVKEEGEDEGTRVRSGFSEDVKKDQPYWVKVFAPEKGDASAYTLELEVTPNKFIDGVVVEIDKKSGCFLMVNKGTNHGVRNGVAANVMQGETILSSGVVDAAFPAISKIRMFGDCRYNAGSNVKIQDMSY